jgi:hypothetical protein
MWAVHFHKDRPSHFFSAALFPFALFPRTQSRLAPDLLETLSPRLVAGPWALLPGTCSHTVISWVLVAECCSLKALLLLLLLLHLQD